MEVKQELRFKVQQQPMAPQTTTYLLRPSSTRLLCQENEVGVRVFRDVSRTIC